MIKKRRRKRMMMTKKRRMVTLLPSEFVSPQDIELKSEEKL